MPMFHCDVCSQDISRLVHIKCAECEDFDLCIPCFTSGSTAASHQPWHPYRVIETDSYPIYTSDWGADEELLLIEGLDTYGIGNWADVADYVGNLRSKEECEQHYMDVYVNSSTYPIPEVPEDLSHDRDEFQARKRRRIENRIAAQKLLPPVGPKAKPVASQPANHEIQGYMPGRLEFETEIENDAEVSIKDFTFDEDLEEDNEAEIQLKLVMLSIYNSRLTRRAERKRVIFEHGLLEYKRNQAVDKRRPKDERDVLMKARPFARMQNAQDYEAFTEGLLTECQLRRHIAELQEWRRNGLTTLDQGQKYEQDKAQRQSVARSTGVLLSGDKFLKPSKASASASGSALATRSLNTPDDANSREGTPKLLRRLSVYPALAEAADGHLLTPAEQGLCAVLRILPKPYLAIKESIIRELLRTGGQLKRKQLRELFKIDTSKAMKIYEFFSQSGWVPKT